MINKNEIINALKHTSKKELALSDEEIKQIVNLVETAVQLNEKWNSKEFNAKIENFQIDEIDLKKEMVEISLNMVTRLIQQMEIESVVHKISLAMESYQDPFPPLVTILTEEEEIELETEFVKPKELHYQFDAISADFNNEYKEHVDVIMETYQKVISELNQYNWKDICKISDDFVIEFITP